MTTTLNHQPRKRFGQNFLTDAGVIHAIIAAIHPTSNDQVLEIGPGLGALTKPLLNQLPSLTAVEIDRDLATELQRVFGSRLELIQADALTVDYSQFGDKLRIVGNLPYNISTPLLFHLMEYKTHIQDMHFMLQKEVVERLAAEPGNRNYGRLSIVLQYDFEVEYLFTVPPQAFSPAPKVESAIVRITPYKTTPFESVDRKQFAWMIAKCFQMKRKTLSNNLKKIISAEELVALDIDPQKRPEHISIAEYVKITRYYASKGG